MSWSIGLGLAGLLALGVIVAILVSVAQKFNPGAPRATVGGVIGSEKLPFFRDPAVTPSLINVIEPPTYENLEAMITAIQMQMQGA